MLKKYDNKLGLMSVNQVSLMRLIKASTVSLQD